MARPTAEQPVKKEQTLQYGGKQRNWIPRHPNECGVDKLKPGQTALVQPNNLDQSRGRRKARGKQRQKRHK